MKDSDIFEMLAKLEAENTHAGKKHILRIYYEMFSLNGFEEFWELMLSFNVKFGIQERSLELKPFTDYGNTKPLMEILRHLSKHNTGAEAEKNICRAYLDSLLYGHQIDYAIRVFTRNLRVGVDVKNFNNWVGSFSDFQVPIFSVQLATQHDKVRNFPQKEDYYVEPKLDGARCIALVKKDSVKLYSRNGLEITGFDDIEWELLNLGVSDIMLDGELIKDGDFKSTMENLHRKEHGKTARYAVFDGMHLLDFYRETCNTPLSSRKEMLQSLFKNSNLEYVYLLNWNFITKDQHEGKLSFFVNCADGYAKTGYEGAMVKPTLSQYTFKRDSSWIKIKEMYTEDFQIIDFVEGKGKYSGTLGAIVINAKGTEVEVGSGFTDEDRDYIWRNRSVLLFTFCEVKYQEVIKKTGSLRFPIFVRLRQDL